MAYIDSGYDSETQLSVADTVVVGRITKLITPEGQTSGNVHAQIDTTSGDTIIIKLIGGVWSGEVAKFLPTDEAVFILKSKDKFVQEPATHRCIDQGSCVVLFSGGKMSVPLASRALRNEQPIGISPEEYAQSARDQIARRSTQAPATS